LELESCVSVYVCVCVWKINQKKKRGLKMKGLVEGGEEGGMFTMLITIKVVINSIT
jgi:hypothetical protein